MKLETGFFEFTETELTKELNKAREIYLQTLKDNNVIDEDTFQKMLHYSIVVARKSFFGSIWDKLWKNVTKSHRYIVVNVIETKEK